MSTEVAEVLRAQPVGAQLLPEDTSKQLASQFLFSEGGVAVSSLLPIVPAAVVCQVHQLSLDLPVHPGSPT